MKIPHLVANWKMYKNLDEVKDYIAHLIPLIENTKVSIYIAAAFPFIKEATELLKGSGILVGAQNLSEYLEGAYTGEVSSVMLKSVGADFVIIGHSERRTLFQESNESIRKKIGNAILDGLMPILCVGESKEQRASGETESLITHQLKIALEDLNDDEVGALMIAYEPVWAIGTGASATPEMAEEVHVHIRRFLTHRWGKAIASRIPILYGGSVKPETISSLLKMPNIDGALIGGASLQAVSFSQIINFARID